MIILLSNNVNFRAKEVTKGKEGRNVIIKGLIHQKDITKLTEDTKNNKVSKYV